MDNGIKKTFKGIDLYSIRLIFSAIIFFIFIFGVPIYSLSKGKVKAQFSSAPEDPSFSYDMRYVPGVKTRGVFLTKELEREVIIETLQSEKKDAKNKALDINLPNIQQAIVLGIIVFLFALYRIRVKNSLRRR